MVALIAIIALATQQAVADSSPFRALALPPAKPSRSASGAPGPRYWQQRADYTLQATLDTATNVLRGTGKIYYVNRSAEPLSFVWVQLDQNLFAPGSTAGALNQPPLLFAGGVVFDFSAKGFVGGITVDRFASAGRQLETKVLGTMMRVELPRPLAPDLSITFDIAWHFPIPPYGGGRMGRVGSRFYELGQWYPRMAVYDDVRGWNTLPYLGAGEFYLEFGDFDVSLTVPAGFVVTATGALANPTVIRTPQERARLARAFTSTEIVPIITRQEAIINATQRVPGTRTWRFTASGVRDFAWAAGTGLRWDASTWDGILIQTFYHPDATPWEDANAMVRFALKHFSGKLGQYPWPQLSAVEGLIEGMEYPMVIYCPSLDKREDQYWVLMHELGHEWFPMQVGSDERRYPWMDEGFNTFADYDAAEAFFKGTAYGDTVRRELLTAYAATAVPGSEQPMITKPDEVRQLYWTAYQKPALMLTILRESVLGRAEFDAAFREYARRWKGKHPQPADFFRTMSNVTGRDLDWFWRSWIYTTARLDQAVDSVRAVDDSTFLYLSSRGQMVLPVTLELRYADGTTETRNLPVEMWNLGSRYTYRLATPKRLASVVIDPQRMYPDIARDNNDWKR
ncbi:MAG: M1 family metallopeptidase [Gemmatimonadales bacterium]